eukprot:1157270-Pelagomonas_calceolata.AAC.20
MWCHAVPTLKLTMTTHEFTHNSSLRVTALAQTLRGHLQAEAAAKRERFEAAVAKSNWASEALRPQQQCASLVQAIQCSLSCLHAVPFLALSPATRCSLFMETHAHTCTRAHTQAAASTGPSTNPNSGSNNNNSQGGGDTADIYDEDEADRELQVSGVALHELVWITMCARARVCMCACVRVRDCARFIGKQYDAEKIMLAASSPAMPKGFKVPHHKAGLLSHLIALKAA